MRRKMIDALMAALSMKVLPRDIGKDMGTGEAVTVIIDAMRTL